MPSSLDYLADLCEQACKRGYVIINEQKRHCARSLRKRPSVPPVTGQDEKRVMELHSRNIGLTAIAAETGRSKSTVWKIIKKKGAGYGSK